MDRRVRRGDEAASTQSSGGWGGGGGGRGGCVWGGVVLHPVTWAVSAGDRHADTGLSESSVFLSLFTAAAQPFLPSFPGEGRCAATDSLGCRGNGSCCLQSVVALNDNPENVDFHLPGIEEA